VFAWLLDPVLALVVRTHRFAFEPAAYGAFEHVDERVAVSVGHRSRTRREDPGRRGEGFALDVRERLVDQGRQGPNEARRPSSK
jgi:hypothetical protein